MLSVDYAFENVMFVMRAYPKEPGRDVNGWILVLFTLYSLFQDCLLSIFL